MTDRDYDPLDHYWLVQGGDETTLYSSAKHAWVGDDDPEYLAWKSEGGVAARVFAESEIWDYLARVAPAGLPRSAQDVKAEAHRRIEAIMPSFKQRNALALGIETVMTYGADPANWPEDLQQVNAAMMDKWTIIKAIRSRSDEIEAMNPIPADFCEDSYWQ